MGLEREYGNRYATVLRNPLGLIYHRSVAEMHAGEIAGEAVRQAASRKGNFVSVTITIEASSQEQLDRIYEDLTAHDEILVAL